MARDMKSPKRAGHLALKSSVLAPTSTSYFGQHMILNHMNSHYRRISSAKAAVDTSAPRSMKKHIRVQDQKRRHYLNGRESEGPLTPGRVWSQSGSLENLSTRGKAPANFPSRPQTSQSPRIDDVFDHSTPAPYSTPRDDLSVHDQYLLHQHRKQRQETLSDSRISFSPRNLPPPLVSHSRWNRIKSKTRNEPLHSSYQPSRETNEHTSYTQREECGQQSLQSPRDDDIDDGAHTDRTNRSSRVGYPGLNTSCSSSTSAYGRRKKELQTKMWEDEQMYLQFISEVTSDVLARGIFTNRVLNKVFESHIDKRKEELDEKRMRDMIDQLKLDLNITDT